MDSEPRLQFNVLGHLGVTRGSEPVDLGAPKQRAVLALLLLHPNEPVSLDRLIDELWGDEAPPRATASLQAYISNLRRVLEPDRPPRAPARLLVSRPPGYAIVVEPDQLDALRFEGLADAGADELAAGNAAAALKLLDEALDLVRGPLLGDFLYQPFAHAHRERMEERRLRAVEDRITAMIDLGRHREVVEELDELTSAHPLHERLWELRMVALYRAGRQADALRAYQDARAILAEELGLEPGPGLQRLERQVLDHDVHLDASRASGGRTPAVASVAVPERPSANLVGRRRELEQLVATWREVLDGTPGVALVAGEAGIGKTALVGALDDLVAAEGARVVWGRCHEQAASAPLWPWTAVLRALGHPDLGRWSTPGAGGEIDAERIAFFDAVTTLLATASDDSPLVVVLDDLHWSDEDSLILLEFLATELRRGRVLLVGTYRADEAQPGTALASTLAGLARRGGVRRVELGGLDDADVARFGEHLAGRALDADTVAVLAERTSGNPFFLTELVRLLAAERRLEAVSDVPASVRDVVRQRVGRLPDDAQSVLRVAAVAGHRFELDVLAVACELEPERLLDVLEPPVLAGLVEEDPQDLDSFRFSHALVADALVEDLSSMRRRRLHARIAHAIETVHAGMLDPHLAALAHHCRNAASPDLASESVDYAVRAARQAEERAALDEAPRLWQLAHDAVAQHPELAPGDVDIDVALAHALARAGRVEGRHVAAEVMRHEAARPSPDVARMVRAATTLQSHGTTWLWPEFRVVHEDVIEGLQATLARLDASSAADRARVQSVLATGLYYGDPVAARELGAEAVAVARDLHDDGLVGEMLLNTIGLHYEIQETSVFAAHADELLEIGERTNRPSLLVAAHTARLDVRFMLGDLAGADADHAAVQALLGAHRVPAIESQIARYPVWAEVVHGRFGAARDLAARAYELSRYIAAWSREESYLTQIIDISRAEGNLSDFADEIQWLASDPRYGAANAWALVRLEQDGVDAARDAIASNGGIVPARRDWRWIGEMSYLAELVVGVADIEQARAAYDELLPHHEKLIVSGSAIACSGPVALLLGRLASTAGDRSAAEHHLLAAADYADRVDAPLWRQQAEHALRAVRDTTG